MRYTGLTGSLGDDCALIKSLNLTRMSISGNNITGSLPDCYLKVRKGVELEQQGNGQG